jgi:CDP-4-dehydro-6-deoxyglucose reductase
MDSAVFNQPKNKIINYQVQNCSALNSDIYEVILTPITDEFLNYQAGQYLMVEHFGQTPLAYSIANAPQDNQQIELHIRYLPNHVQVKQLFNKLHQKKCLLSVSGPYGNCIQTSNTKPLILLAGGTGFAPCKAIIEQQLKQGLDYPLYLYWGARTFADLYLHELAQSWAEQYEQFNYIPVLSRALRKDHWQKRTGWVHQAVIDDHANLSKFEVYASGPLAMVKAAYSSFIKQGLLKNNFCTDLLESVFTVEDVLLGNPYA